MTKTGKGALTVAAVLAGLALGWVAAGQRERHYRQDLFHPRPLRRLAALGWLEGQPGAETLRLRASVRSSSARMCPRKRIEIPTGVLELNTKLCLTSPFLIQSFLLPM